MLLMTFQDLLKKIDLANDLDDDERTLSREKAEAVAQAVATASTEPGGLRRALLDAQGLLQTSAGWVWHSIRSTLTSEAGTRILSGITEAAAKAAITSVLVS